MVNQNEIDKKYMNFAINLAEKNMGLTFPNPSVGAVIVIDEVIVGTGITAVNGRPHAEKIAIDDAVNNLKQNDEIKAYFSQKKSLKNSVFVKSAHKNIALENKDIKNKDIKKNKSNASCSNLDDYCKRELSRATIYVTLEPCSHYGETSPCVDVIISSGIKKCVVSCLDVDKRVNGKGVQNLKKHGAKVVVGVLEKKATFINEGFFIKIKKKRPLITIKTGSSLDGKISLLNGKSKWITNERSRRYAHFLRANHDAIICGENTILTDNPKLNCRLSGMENQSPIVIVNKSFSKNFKNSITYDGNIDDLLKQLYINGITRLLVEGGSKFATKLLNLKLVDYIAHFSAPIIIGNDGNAFFNNLGIDDLDKTIKLKETKNKSFNNDKYALYKVKY